MRLHRCFFEVHDTNPTTPAVGQALESWFFNVYQTLLEFSNSEIHPCKESRCQLC
jgi:hypothetical protein